jgi:hypothetical protein
MTPAERRKQADELDSFAADTERRARDIDVKLAAGWPAKRRDQLLARVAELRAKLEEAEAAIPLHDAEWRDPAAAKAVLLAQAANQRERAKALRVGDKPDKLKALAAQLAAQGIDVAALLGMEHDSDGE